MILLNSDFQTSVEGIFALGGAISPAYIAIETEGAFKERKHSNLIYTAVKDAIIAMEAIVRRMGRNEH